MLTQIGVAGGIIAVLYFVWKILGFFTGHLCSVPVVSWFPFCH